MPIHLHLEATDGLCRARLAADPQRLLAETRIDALPKIGELRERPYEAGLALYQALGGDALRALLDADPQGVLLLECDQDTAAIAWEYAAGDERRFLACDYGLLRLEPRPPRPTDLGIPPRLLVLCADPLVYPDNHRPRYPLDFAAELAALDRALRGGSRALVVRRVPPTAERLIDALADGPALIHFSCHGGLPALDQQGQPAQDVVLLLEDATGQLQPLPGRDLRRDAPRGSLRMVLFSACETAALARALVRDGIPVALGMQHTFPDPLSDTLAATFYRWLAAGRDVAEATRQARRALAAEHPGAAGLLAAYTCADSWGPLPLPDGRPTIQLDLAAHVRVPDNIIPPPVTGLLGRDAELVAVARAFVQGAPVVTIAGSGGMGKTALAAAFLRRFGWLFGRVLGISFANAPVDLGRVCRELLERAGQAEQVGAILSDPGARDAQIKALRRRLAERREQRAYFGLSADPAIIVEIEDLEAQLAALQAQDLAALAVARLRERLLEAVRPGDLFVFDNYESVLTPAPGAEGAAQPVARLLRLLLDRGARLLLTSRARPAGFPGELLIPSQQGLAGLSDDDAVALFLRYSPRARSPIAGRPQTGLAQAVARVTEGYPLAVLLLASAYENSGADPEGFLAAWPTLLADAQAQGLDERHTRFATAVAFSLAPLTGPQRDRLRDLAGYDVPFFAEAAVFAWGLPLDADGWPAEESLRLARADLALFANRSLVEIEGYFEGSDTPATYRFQPALRQELRGGGTAAPPAAPPGVAAYGAWLAQSAYGEIGRWPALARLVYQSLPLLDAATSALDGEGRLWHIHRLAWLREQYGELAQARTQLEAALSEPAGQMAVRGALQYELANIYRVQGQYDEAMRLYRDSLGIYEALQDQQGKAATLHEMAYIYRVQGQHDEAMRLYHESLSIYEVLQDQRGKATTLHSMAYIYRVQGQHDEAMRLYRDSLAITEALRDEQGKGATLNEMAYIYSVRGQHDEAMRLYRDSLAIKEALQDQRGKAATLSQMANIYRVQGQHEEAMRLYRDSLAIKEALQDQEGTAATLSQLADLHMQRGDWDGARESLRTALSIARQLRDPAAQAFVTVKLGQLALAQGDMQTALSNYREGLATFERLHMPREAQQVRELIAQAEAQGGRSLPLDQAIAAWLAGDEGDDARTQALLALLNAVASAVVEACRAGDAVAAEALAQALIPLRAYLRTWPPAAALPPFGALLGCFQALLRGDHARRDRLRARLDGPLSADLAEVERLIGADEQTLRAEARERQIAELRRQVAAAMPQALRDDDQQRRAQFILWLVQNAAQAAEGEQAGSPRLALAAFLRACIAFLNDQPYDRDGLPGDDLAQLDAWARTSNTQDYNGEHR